MSWTGLLKRVGEAGNPTARPNLRTFFGKIEHADPNSDPLRGATKGDSFKPEGSYFSVRIVEMRLAEAGRYFIDYVPMCSCFLRHTYGRTPRTIPFVLGTETIATGLGQNVPKGGARNIQFKDVDVARNVPVKADNLFMYTALCRFKDAGFVRGLLDLLSDAAGAVAGPAVGSVAHAGVDLTKRLGTLLGADGVETRLGMLNGNALDTSGYRVFAGVPASDLSTQELAMRDGQLVRRRDDGSEATVDDIDYIVLAVEHRATLVEENFGQVSILPFHTNWDVVRTKLLEGDKDGADGVLRRLLIEVATSPDVTEADRLNLIACYRGAFDQWAAAGATSHMSFGDVAPLSARLEQVSRRWPAISNLLECIGTSIATSDRDLQKHTGSILERPKDVEIALAHRAMAANEATTKFVDGSDSEKVGTVLSDASTLLLSAALA
jgi:hypothetical protein